MSASREKRKRAIERSRYEWELSQWRRSEPPKWAFISHWLWKREKPEYKGK